MVKGYILRQLTKDELVEIVQVTGNEYKVTCLVTHMINKKLEELRRKEHNSLPMATEEQMNDFFSSQKQIKKWEDNLRNV